MTTTVSLLVNDTWMPDKPVQLYVVAEDEDSVAAEGGRIRVLTSGTFTLEYQVGVQSGAAAPITRGNHRMIPIGAGPAPVASSAAPPGPSRPGRPPAAPVAQGAWEMVILKVRDAAAVLSGSPAAVPLPDTAPQPPTVPGARSPAPVASSPAPVASSTAPWAASAPGPPRPG